MTGGSLVLSVLMIFGLLLLVVSRGAFHFWPGAVERFELTDGTVLMGEVTEVEAYEPSEGVLVGLDDEERARAETLRDPETGLVDRSLVRTGNFDLTQTHFHWIESFKIAGEATEPDWALVVERMAWGRFYGEPLSFLLDGQVAADTPAEVWDLFREHHGDVRERWEEKKELEDDEMGAVNARVEAARLAVREAELDHGADSERADDRRKELARVQGQAQVEYDALREQIEALERENARFAVVLRTADGVEKEIALADVVRAYPANRVGFGASLGIFGSRWWEYLTAEPREANSEGGVFPAIFGTVLMTLIMCVLVVPFGVLAALYLREYAKPGPLVTVVRIAVNNLAGVPSIVFGVFGLGFFCYLIGASLDELFFAAKLPNPTLGKGGLLWASLTLALLTLPVVIVATEEALAAVPNSMREGSYGCGATKWQTIQKIVLPRALPGILTGAILAIARGAGEVAPLMLVGAVKLAPELPIALDLPLMGTERSFMHLGFHIFDLGFQSQNSEAAKPMVFTTTLLLIAIVVALNISAMWVRGRLRSKFEGGAV